MMTIRTAWLLLTICAMGAAEDRATRFASVRISVFDSFGQELRDCSVLYFIEGLHVTEFGTVNSDERWDHAAQFSGLSGRGIPFGIYRLTTTCGDDDFRGSEWVQVRAPEVEVMLAFWPHKGDYQTGSDPRLTVSYGGGTRGGALWAKAVGVFVDRAETVRLDPSTGKARFFSLLPARYLVLILEEGRLRCASQVDLLDTPAALEVKADCGFVSASNARQAGAAK